MVHDFIHYAINSRLGIIGWGLIIVVLFLWLTRSSGKIIGAVIMLIIVVLLARAVIDRLEQAASAMVDHANNIVSNAIPDWLKQLWQKIDNHLPSPGDFAADKACDYAGISIACNILKRDKQLLDQINTDQKEVEAICKDSPEVERKFGDAGQTMFCAGNPFKQAYRQIRAIGGGVVLGTADSISSFLVPDPPTLDTDQYFHCLYDKLKTRADVRAASCTYADPHEWRLCVEFHMQLPHEKPGGASASTPLDPDILACRKQAYNLN